MVVMMIGEPASGKTTLMKELKSRLGPMVFKDKPFSHYENENFVIFGKYDSGIFQGTDKLSMAVQSKAVEFCMFEKKRVIIFEGDRLGNISFINAVKEYHETKIFLVSCSEKSKLFRHDNRKDSQSEQFKKAKKTKINNIKSAFSCEALENECPLDIERNVNKILTFINSTTRRV